MALEDLTTYTETGADAGKISQTSARNTWTGIERQEQAFLSKSFGANFFNSNARINVLFEAIVDSTPDIGSIVTVDCFADVIKDWQQMTTDSDFGIRVQLQGTSVNRYWHSMDENHGGTSYIGSLVGLTAGDTQGYNKFYYDSGVGAFGTIYLEVYSDAPRTVLIGSTSLALHAAPSFEYHIPFGTQGGGSSLAMSGLSENYDLQLPSVGALSPYYYNTLLSGGN